MEGEKKCEVGVVIKSISNACLDDYSKSNINII